jgi:uncharacterized protein YjiS (DUF1127 family)
MSMIFMSVLLRTFIGAVSKSVEYIERWKCERTAIAALCSMTDYELKDIGMRRSQIRHLVRLDCEERRRCGSTVQVESRHSGAS